ncbi:MAG: PCP reductase family protein [Nitrospirae bacterium]|nr:PCP reductase family protein [Nitrospirota bacterium]
MEWTEEAESRLENIPPFARPMVKTGIEKLAMEKGYKKITSEVMDEARERFM